MKPTSIIFIILAAILVFVGVIVCVVGGIMANAQDIELICDKTDADGNDVVTQSLSEFGLTDINIDIKNVDVNIIGQSVESYIEFKNINAVTYDFTINKQKLNLNSANPFDVASIVKFRENDGGFAGLRHYLYLNKYKKDISEVNIYILPGQDIKNIKINTNGGDITVKNMIGDTAYQLSAVNGNLVFENTNTDGDLAVDVKKGNFTFNASNAGSVDFTVENGNGKFALSGQYNFSCQCESGKIYLDDENVGDSYVGAYPEYEQQEGEEILVPDSVKGKITSGDLVIDTAE